MRNVRTSAVGVLTILTLAACSAGPHQLQRSVDDWDRKIYVNSPVMNGFLHLVPVIPVASLVAGIGDFFVTDASTFWFQDAWDGKGTGFEHAAIASPDGTMSSLLNENSGWLTIKK